MQKLVGIHKVYFAGYPETALWLIQYNGNTQLLRDSIDPPDSKMTELFCSVITNAHTDLVTVDNLPQGVVVETYKHTYKGARGIQVHLLNMTGMISGMLSTEPGVVNFPDIKTILPDKGKPINITVRDRNIKDAFMLSPDFEGLYEIPLEKTADGVVGKIPTFGRFLVVYFNLGAAQTLQNLSGMAIRKGQPEIKNIEIPEPPPKSGTIRKMASGETVSASSELEDKYAAWMAYDDNPGGCWCCADDWDVNSWWMIDFGKILELEKVLVKYRNINGFQFVPLTVTVQVSFDGTNWQNTVSKSANVPPPGTAYHDTPFEYPAQGKARFLRLLFEDGGTRYAGFKVVQLVEVKVGTQEGK